MNINQQEAIYRSCDDSTPETTTKLRNLRIK